MSNILNQIKLSGVTYQIEDSGALHTLDSAVTSEGTNAVAGSGIYNAITAATNALAEAVAEEMSGKTDVSAFTSYTSSTESVLSGKAEQSDLDTLSGTVTAHTSDTEIHVTTTDKSNWNAKADISDIPSVTGYADSVIYNSASKYVEFYHGGTGGTKVFEYDAAPFLIDGMVQNVEVKDVEISGETVTCLVISFNTDAGKQDINIPISEIFDASNYYTTAQTDTKISEATSGKVDTTTYTAYTAATDTVLSGKQDTLTPGAGIAIDTANTISVTGIPLTIDDTVTSGSSNPVKSSGIYNFVTGETATKQDTLVNQTNIKSVGGESLLGAGNVATLHAEVTGTTLILDLS